MPAALETLVHLNPPVPFNYVAFRLQFDATLIENIPLNRLPAAAVHQGHRCCVGAGSKIGRALPAKRHRPGRTQLPAQPGASCFRENLYRQAGAVRR